VSIPRATRFETVLHRGRTGPLTLAKEVIDARSSSWTGATYPGDPGDRHAPPQQAPPERSRWFFGVRVDDVTWDEMLACIERFIAEGTPHQVATVNPEFVMAARRDPEFRAVINNAALAIPDGVGLLWAGRLLSQPLRERVTGSDGVPRIAERAAVKGWRLFLLGAAPGIAQETARRLVRRYPGLKIVGTYAGSPAAKEENYIVGLVRRARPDVLFVAYGHPKQDKWIARNLDQLDVPVCMGVGGAFDFIAGLVPRAPAWMQRAGLEHFYRLLRQPWRWRRQVDAYHFGLLVFLASLRQRVSLLLH
jgi:N-acetylglucosaminyldiphosphoundecaprenol N-acetyl-beta-D-mannosaminyltransferase